MIPRTLTEGYFRRNRGKVALLLGLVFALPVVFCISISLGATSISFWDTLSILCGFPADERSMRIVLNIRLPQAVAAILVGAGLGISGTTMQAVLRNPLCSPFTLGISSAAAFGAALMLLLGGVKNLSPDHMIFNGEHSSSMVALGAFAWAVITMGVVLFLGRVQGTRSETMILMGVALNSLFTAGLMLLQYIADESRLAAIVYWTFGDTARANWNTILVIFLCVAPVSLWFLFQSWNYNALVFGEETAQGLGVSVRKLRVLTLLLSSFLAAIMVSLLGIIGFVGLVVPHLSRLCIGSDHRFSLPCSLLLGAILLLSADAAARWVLAPRLLPVSILTAFIGVPVFLALLLKRKGI